MNNLSTNTAPNTTPEADSSQIASALLDRIKAKRQIINGYISKHEPRHNRLINFSIISGCLAALLTVGPGVGGNDFVNAIKNYATFGIPIWQILCFAASLCSVVAVITNSMLKSSDIKQKVDIARSCDAKLEGLEMMVELSQIENKQATQLYAKYLSEIPHV